MEKNIEMVSLASYKEALKDIENLKRQIKDLETINYIKMIEHQQNIEDMRRSITLILKSFDNKI